MGKRRDDEETDGDRDEKEGGEGAELDQAPDRKDHESRNQKRKRMEVHAQDPPWKRDLGDLIFEHGVGRQTNAVSIRMSADEVESDREQWRGKRAQHEDQNGFDQIKQGDP